MHSAHNLMSLKNSENINFVKINECFSKIEIQHYAHIIIIFFIDNFLIQNLFCGSDGDSGQEKILQDDSNMHPKGRLTICS